MYKVIYSPESLRDLLKIKEIVSIQFSENTAVKVIKSISQSINSLERYPFLGVDLGKKLEVATEYRYLFVEKNYVFYYVEQEKVKIVRVLNERQDYLIKLFNIKNID